MFFFLHVWTGLRDPCGEVPSDHGVTAVRHDKNNVNVNCKFESKILMWRRWEKNTLIAFWAVLRLRLTKEFKRTLLFYHNDCIFFKPWGSTKSCWNPHTLIEKLERRVYPYEMHAPILNQFHINLPNFITIPSIKCKQTAKVMSRPACEYATFSSMNHNEVLPWTSRKHCTWMMRWMPISVESKHAIFPLGSSTRK